MNEPFIGQIAMFGFNFPPRSWLRCDGQLLAISSNEAMFSLLGTMYGGDGRTSFGLPDLRGRSAVHQGQGPGLSNRRVGERGGSEMTNLVTNNIPAHSHGVTVRVADQQGAHHAAFKGALGSVAINDTTANPVEVYVKNTDATFKLNYTLGGLVENSVGASAAFGIMNPFLVVNICIATTGIYPSRD